MIFQKGQIYKSGGVVFEITDVIEVTRWFSNIQFRIVNCDIFRDWILDIGSKELEEKIEKGLAKNVVRQE